MGASKQQGLLFAPMATATSGKKGKRKKGSTTPTLSNLEQMLFAQLIDVGLVLCRDGVVAEQFRRRHYHECVGMGLIEPVCQLAPIAGRRFRFDLAYPSCNLLIEVHGGTWAQGRHNRGAGFAMDREKCNLATLAGWRVLEVCRKQIEEGHALEWITRAVRG